MRGEEADGIEVIREDSDLLGMKACKNRGGKEGIGLTMEDPHSATGREGGCERIANGNAFTASLPPSRTMGILHGEAYALLAASILARLHPQQITIFSDHLNSICLLSSHPSLISLKNNPARSLYRWILN